MATALPSTGAPGPDAQTGCDTRDLFVIHNLFRKLFTDAKPLVEGVQDGDTARASIVSDHIAEVADGLHNHHTGEDVLLWDRLEQRAPSCIPHVEQMKDQHARIAEQVNVLVDALPAWRASGSTVDRGTVLAALAPLTTALVAHLGQEEEQIVPVASTALSQAEWNELGDRGRSEIPRDRLFIQLGYMLDPMDAAGRAAFLKESLPAPVRLLYRLIGQRQFEKHRDLVNGTVRS
jgi:hemerythrin-like domain-containing protein